MYRVVISDFRFVLISDFRIDFQFQIYMQPAYVIVIENCQSQILNLFENRKSEIEIRKSKINAYNTTSG
ncbi:MAG TPA: hypothetical protein DCF33_12315 [Saprospirales bacterium]|nr:hypothetical protein [Saprospirales bacterium]